MYLFVLLVFICLISLVNTGYYLIKISMNSKLVQVIILATSLLVANAVTCNSNQYTASNDTCVNCPQYCVTCSTDQICTSCQADRYIVSLGFSATCRSCSQIYLGCNTCLLNIACTACNSGYFLNSGACSLCSSTILNCVSCSTNGNTCTQCGYPYILKDNQCVSPTIQAIIQNPQSNPTNPALDLITLGNGTQVAPKLDINGCNQIQFFFQGRCIRTIPRCKIYQPSGLCSVCDSNYLVTIYGDCTIKNRYLACEPGYWLDSVSDSCKKVSPACDFYYPNSGQCFNCSKGYEMVNGKCKQAIKCNSRQFFSNGLCVDVPAQCITFSEIDGACTTCAVGYELNGGLCAISKNAIVGGANCQFPCNTCHFANDRFCFSCVIFYQLSGARYGTCIPVPR